MLSKRNVITYLSYTAFCWGKKKIDYHPLSRLSPNEALSPNLSALSGGFVELNERTLIGKRPTDFFFF